MKKLLLLLALAVPVFSDQVAVNNFSGGINNNNNPATIGQDTAQDLLNVDITPGGLSVKKRSGYGLYKALSTGQPTHGGFHAFDSTGNDYQLWGSSRSLIGIVADATPTVLVSSATLGSTWDCADSQGNSYCVNSNRDAYIRTNGTTMTWYATPLGTMVETTPDRMIVAGVSGSPNTLYVSQSNTFTNFVTGVNDTDAFTEVIASQGSKLTHIRWACGKILWWKDQSFGYFDFDNQYQAQVKTVSDTIGTFDNTSAVDPGGNTWFRGQDGHTWKYDCSSLSKESVDITANVQASGSRTSNLWSQTTQADFQAGGVTFNGPSVSVSTTILSGSVVPSSFTGLDTSSSTFISGTGVNVIIGNSDVRISTNNSGNVDNNGCETDSSGNCLGWSNTGSANWARSTGYVGSPCSISPKTGSGMFTAGFSSSFHNPYNLTFNVRKASDDSVVATVTKSITTPLCAWTLGTIPSTDSFIGQRMKLEMYLESANPASGLPRIYKTTATYVYGGEINFYYNSSSNGSWDSFPAILVDDITGGSSTITSGSFTSRTFDTLFTTSVVQGQASWTADDSNPIFVIQHSTSTLGPWSTVIASSGTNAQANRYLRYVSSFTVASNQDAVTTLNDVTLIATSSGTFYSAVKNAPNLTAWSTFGAATSLDGGTETFYMRSSTSVFTVLSATPSWTAQTNGGLITISTGTYFQVRDDFAITAATQSPTLNDFTVNWFEGSATDQAYMLYFENAIWQSVAFGAAQSVNNYIFKKDLINDAWTLYNFGVGGMLVQSNRLYFGSTSAGNVFNYGTTTSDNGTAIQSYWKSKEFAGPDLFLQTQLTNIDTFAKKDQGSTLTATYTVETSSSTSYSISLSSASQTLIQSRKLLPSGKMGYTFSMQYGDTSTSSSWELLGFRIGFTQQPYRPSN